MLCFVFLNILLAPTVILVKESFLAGGFFFFFLIPIASRNRSYRLFTSPTVWLFFFIPTHCTYRHLTACPLSDTDLSVYSGVGHRTHQSGSTANQVNRVTTQG